MQSRCRKRWSTSESSSRTGSRCRMRSRDYEKRSRSSTSPLSALKAFARYILLTIFRSNICSLYALFFLLLNNSMCQEQLPATGVPIRRHRFDHMQEKFNEYVKTRTLQNWKFWIVSFTERVVTPLLINNGALHCTFLLWCGMLVFPRSTIFRSDWDKHVVILGLVHLRCWPT